MYRPWAVNFSLKPPSFDSRIRVSPAFRFFRIGLQHKDAAQHAVIHKRTRYHQFVFGVQPADVGHVLFLKLGALFFAQLWGIGRSLEQYEKVLLFCRLFRWCRRGRWFLGRRRVGGSRLVFIA